MCPCAEFELLSGGGEQGSTFRAKRCDVVEGIAAESMVGLAIGVALTLNGSGLQHLVAQGARGLHLFFLGEAPFGSGLGQQQGGVHRCDVQMNVDAIEQRATHFFEVALPGMSAASALLSSFGIRCKAATWAGIHRGDELKVRWKNHSGPGSAHGYFPGLHGLPKNLQHVSRHFGQFVQEQDSCVRKADFSRSRI